MYDVMIARRLERELQELFGEASYHLDLKPCTGKYRGHTDMTLIFGSGRQLYIGLDERNYINNLQDELRAIRHFRAYQTENTERINAVLREHDTPFRSAKVEIVPYDRTNHLTLYAAVVLTPESGIQLVYRTSTMHGYLMGYDAPHFSFDRNMEHLLQDSCGKMAYTGLLPKTAAA